MTLPKVVLKRVFVLSSLSLLAVPQVEWARKAVELELALPSLRRQADTHLVYCATLDSLGEHSLALGQAQAALRLLREELFVPLDRLYVQGVLEDEDEGKRMLVLVMWWCGDVVMW